MKQTDLCLARIQQVRAIACNPELAYPARTRLQRTILSCTQLIADRVGLEEPLFPGPYKVPDNAPLKLQKMCAITNRLVDRSKSICQPSEPLDDRWSEGWSEILGYLDELERNLYAT